MHYAECFTAIMSFNPHDQPASYTVRIPILERGTLRLGKGECPHCFDMGMTEENHVGGFPLEQLLLLLFIITPGPLLECVLLIL